MKVVAMIMAAALAVVAFGPGASAQKRDLLGSFRDWDALVIERDNGEKICYMISIPKSKQPTSVTHGDVYITVTHRPRRKVRDEVNFVTAYDLKTGSDARATIGGSRYSMFTEGKGAWNADPGDDTRMVSSMKRGNDLVVTATSARGTNTTYKFSLLGFTAAYNAISEACS